MNNLFILNGKKYVISTSKLIAIHKRVNAIGTEWYTTEIYKTKKGNFFKTEFIDGNFISAEDITAKKGT